MVWSQILIAWENENSCTHKSNLIPTPGFVNSLRDDYSTIMENTRKQSSNKLIWFFKKKGVDIRKIHYAEANEQFSVVFFSNRNQENLIKLPEFIIVLLNFIQVEILTRNHNFKLKKKNCLATESVLIWITAKA